MTYSISNIAAILGLQQPGHPDALVDILLTDSRSLVYPERTLFFALRTASGDGHKYIEELYNRGVRNFVVDTHPTLSYPDANFLVVADTVEALQTVAADHRHRFEVPVVGITGSRGKTTVKEWLNQLLQPDYKVVRSPRSYNSRIGVPLSIWEMDETTEIGIFEAGISRAGEMDPLQRIIDPTIGIITNIGPEHSEGFSSAEEKCREKVRLLSDCRVAVYNADDPLISRIVAETPIAGARLGVGSAPDATLKILEAQTTSRHTLIRYRYHDDEGTLTIPFIAPHQIRDAMLCVAVMLFLGCDAADIAHRVGELQPVATRLDVSEGAGDCLIIHDSYTADFGSLGPALDFMERRATASRTSLLILSDVMHDSATDVPRLYRRIADVLRDRGVDRFIGIGEEMAKYQGYFDVNSTFYPSTDEFLQEVSVGDFSHEMILVKGAPRFDFSRITEMLEARRYETVLDVNLDALVSNYNFFRSHLRPATGVVCMLKASGYGAGSLELAKTLQTHGAAYLGVAVTDEGVELRQAGITMPIMVLNPRVVNYRDLFTYRLEPEIYSFAMLDEIEREARKYGITDYPVHIKLDTGMHRLGFSEEEVPDLNARLLASDTVRPASVFSHLATADCLDMDSYTLGQLRMFDRCTQRLQQGFSHHILRHILNTAGILRFPQWQYDMVRLGIGLYGVQTLPPECGEDALRPVSSLRTVILALSRRHPGDSIGYSRRGRVERESLIATCPVGYADGLNRHLGNGRLHVLVGDTLCPIIGNICMDICMVDVTDAPGVKVGDPVEIFGERQSVQTVADVLDTIPYEVLTSVSTRVKRVYFRE